MFTFVDGLIVMLPARSGVPLLPPVTVTEQVSVLPPSLVVTVIVAEPAATAVTTPSFATVAFAGSLVDHVTALFVAFLGSTVGVRVADFPNC